MPHPAPQAPPTPTRAADATKMRLCAMQKSLFRHATCAYSLLFNARAFREQEKCPMKNPQGRQTLRAEGKKFTSREA